MSQVVRIRKTTLQKLDSLQGETLDDKIDNLIQNPKVVEKVVEEKCDQIHLSVENFNQLNELCNHDLTTYDGTEKDVDKMTNLMLKGLIESAIGIKKGRSEGSKWPDYQCPFLKKLDALSGQCLKDTPEKRYSITTSDCWACMKRGKMNRQKEGRYTVQEYINKKLDPNRCPDCAGSGTIPHEAYSPISSRHETIRETCPKCKGTGRIA